MSYKVESKFEVLVMRHRRSNIKEDYGYEQSRKDNGGDILMYKKLMCQKSGNKEKDISSTT